MRKALVASAVVVLIWGSASYAWMGGRPKEQPVEATTVETARLFAAPNDVSPAPAKDLIATKLATVPVIWPDAPKAAPDVQKKSQAASKPKKKQQAQKPKKQPTVTGSL